MAVANNQDVPTYIAWDTGGVYQIYRYEGDVDENTARYALHMPNRIFKSMRACELAIRELPQ